MSHHFTTTKDLERFLAAYHARPPQFVGIDTEFMRRTTYWPKLCLIEIAMDDALCTIDYCAPGMDLSPLLPFLTNQNIPKIFHAATQDIDCLERALNVEIKNIFDIQIAWMCLEATYMPSYQYLVHTHIGIKLEKTQQTIDWTQRPLPQCALDYARADVEHLGILFKKFSHNLDHKKRSFWMQEEMQCARKKTTLKPWQKIQKWNFLETTPQALSLLMRLSLWREECAQTRDVLRQAVADDQTLYSLAQKAEKPDIKERIINILGDESWHYIQAHIVPLPPRFCALNALEKKHIKDLRAQATQCAAAHNLPPTFLVTHKEIEYYVRHNALPKRLEGWRGTLLKWDH